MAVSAIGWKYFIYFFSLGYGFSIVALGAAIAIMFCGTRRLELRQNKIYGDDDEYRKYVRTTPIIIPLIPLYSVEKYKFLVA